MSENENQPPAPSKQTSSVPLKKETVRVTLKAADAPPAVPSATVPVKPPVPGGAPPVPGAPPTAVGGPPRPPAPAPTIPLRTAGTPTAPAPTIRLATTAAPTSPARPGGAPPPTMALPKATVQLQTPTQPLGTTFSSTSASTLSSADDDDDAEENEGLANILSGVGLAAALVVLAFQLMTASAWVEGDWGQLF